ncbi:MAG: DUF6404 family protein [Ruegeria sp.]
METYELKLERAVTELENAGLCRERKLSRYVRTLRWLGLKPKPELYCSFAWIVTWVALTAAPFWGFCMHFLVWQQDYSILLQVVSAGVFGTAFGVFSAKRNLAVRKSHGLSSWEKL